MDPAPPPPQRSEKKAGGEGGGGGTSLFSLSEYLPRLGGGGSKQRRASRGFDPFAEYCAAAPNEYERVKVWQKQRRDVGMVPSKCIVLRNMTDVVNDGLEAETREECEAFGEVVRCTVAEEQESVVVVVVEFGSVEAAVRAREALDQRFFDGRHISAQFRDY
ncbi:Splicing factor 45 [Coemansia aciculifera]|uniref:Splicing factor 45 n=1 Tax=Coemansia aciculifera TaxID=417176 RepID=A0ACC1LXX3_9FUNG|nr:Splicing factor 45 [Coemansia aciculifera]